MVILVGNFQMKIFIIHINIHIVYNDFLLFSFVFVLFFIVCRSFWVKRDVGNINHFVANIGTTPGVSPMLSMGYRYTNTFTMR
jgi:hypothetical protein